MYLRQNVLPRNISDACVTTFTLCIIPVVYYFELFVVLPHYYPTWDFWYCLHFIIGTFILFNVCSNYVAIVFCDTSIRGRLLPTILGPSSRFCTVCECIAPPRSWHCDVCGICILKRDHHCIFTSCCIGHYNLRYFVMFVFYIFLATLYATYYNLFFLIEFGAFSTLESVVKLIFPLAALFVNYSLHQLYLFVMLVVFIGGAFTATLLYYHLDLILKGIVTHERKHKLGQYDLGRTENIIEALGNRWYLVWLSPFLHSALPHDGINWNSKQSAKAK